MIQAEVKKRAPKRSGQLAKYIQVRAIKRSRVKVGWLIKSPPRDKLKAEDVPNRERYYPAHLEFGTSKMPAKPYMRPAFDAKVDEAIAEVVKEVRAHVRKALRKKT